MKACLIRMENMYKCIHQILMYEAFIIIYLIMKCKLLWSFIIWKTFITTKRWGYLSKGVNKDLSTWPQSGVSDKTFLAQQGQDTSYFTMSGCIFLEGLMYLYLTHIFVKCVFWWIITMTMIWTEEWLKYSTLCVLIKVTSYINAPRIQSYHWYHTAKHWLSNSTQVSKTTKGTE